MGARGKKKKVAKKPVAAALAKVAAPAAPDKREAALLRLSRMETIADAYEAWLELTVEHAAMKRRFTEEARRFEREGSFMLGAVRAAGSHGGEGDALKVASGLDQVAAEASQKLQAALARVNAEAAAQEAAFSDAFAAVKQELRARVNRIGKGSKLKLHLYLRPVGASRTILHLARVSPDESVVLCQHLSGALPTRHGFLFDDSTDDVMKDPQPLYADEGVTEVRPSAPELKARVEAAVKSEFLPVKGFIPAFVEGPSGVRLYRLLQRGAVMEVELFDAGSFRNVLTKEEGELFAGRLLRLKLEGAVDLELEAG